jgi:hypothetical protein
MFDDMARRRQVASTTWRLVVRQRGDSSRLRPRQQVALRRLLVGARYNVRSRRLIALTMWPWDFVRRDQSVPSPALAQEPRLWEPHPERLILRRWLEQRQRTFALAPAVEPHATRERIDIPRTGQTVPVPGENADACQRCRVCGQRLVPPAAPDSLTHSPLENRPISTPALDWAVPHSVDRPCSTAAPRTSFPLKMARRVPASTGYRARAMRWSRRGAMRSDANRRD